MEEIEFTCPICNTHRAVPGIYVRLGRDLSESIHRNKEWEPVCPPASELTVKNIIKTVKSLNWNEDMEGGWSVYIININGEALEVSGCYPDGFSCMFYCPEPRKNFVILQKPKTVKEMTDILLSFFIFEDNPKVVGDNLIWNQKEYDYRVLIKTAKNREKYLDFDKAIKIYEQIGEPEEAKRVRKLKANLAGPKTVVHGDYVDDRDTIVKDSVINRSNIGAAGDDKFTKLKELKEMLAEGLIDNDEFKQMKKEILGK